MLSLTSTWARANVLNRSDIAAKTISFFISLLNLATKVLKIAEITVTLLQNMTITNHFLISISLLTFLNAPNSIGASKRAENGTVTIGGVVTGNITESPYIYEPGK